MVLGYQPVERKKSTDDFDCSVTWSPFDAKGYAEKTPR